LFLSNLDNVPLKHKQLGLVFGVGVPPMRIDWKTAEIDKVIEDGIERANNHMIERAEKMGADAILKIYYEKETSELGVRIMAWGTAIQYLKVQ